MSQIVEPRSAPVPSAWLAGSRRLRRAASADDRLVEELFRESRRAELDALPDEAMRSVFVSMQLAARDAHYSQLYPTAESLIIVPDAAELGASESVTSASAGIGRVLVAATPRGLHIVDVAVLECEQRRGHGTAVFAELFDRADAAGLPVTLTVSIANEGAQEFYLATGFVSAGGGDEASAHLRLHRLPYAERRAA